MSFIVFQREKEKEIEDGKIEKCRKKSLKTEGLPPYLQRSCYS